MDLKLQLRRLKSEVCKLWPLMC